jgi:hypothetical protein
VEVSALEDYIARMYDQTRSFIANNPVDEETTIEG